MFAARKIIEVDRKNIPQKYRIACDRLNGCPAILLFFNITNLT